MVSRNIDKLGHKWLEHKKTGRKIYLCTVSFRIISTTQQVNGKEVCRDCHYPVK